MSLVRGVLGKLNSIETNGLNKNLKQLLQIP